MEKESIGDRYGVTRYNIRDQSGTGIGFLHYTSQDSLEFANSGISREANELGYKLGVYHIQPAEGIVEEFERAGFAVVREDSGQVKGYISFCVLDPPGKDVGRFYRTQQGNLEFSNSGRNERATELARRLGIYHR